MERCSGSPAAGRSPRDARPLAVLPRAARGAPLPVTCLRPLLETVTQVGVTALCLILLPGSRLYGLLIATPVATAVIGIATMVLGGSPVAVTVLAWRQGSRRRPDGGMIPGRGLERQRWAVTERTPGVP